MILAPNRKMFARRPKLIACSVEAGKVSTCQLSFGIDNTPAALNVSPTEPAITLWVSESGSDSNDGSSLAQAFASLNKAFDILSRRHWEGGATIFISGTVPVTGSNFTTPLYPRSGISGSSGFILVTGSNATTLGPFSVASTGTWTAATTTLPTFVSVTTGSSLGVADGSLRGSFLFFLTGSLAGVQVPIRNNVGSTIFGVEMLVPSAGDTFSICTPGDTLDVSTPGDVFVTSLFPAPLCLRDLNLTSSGGGGYTSDDRSGYVILRRVAATVPSGGYLFDINVSGDGLYVDGASDGYLQSFLTAKSQLVRTFFDGGNFQLQLPGILQNTLWFHDTLLVEGVGAGSPFGYTGGRGSLTNAAFVGSSVQVGLHADLIFTNVSWDLSLAVPAVPLVVNGSQVSLVDVEVLNGTGSNNIELQNSTATAPSGSLTSDGAGQAGIFLDGASSLHSAVPITGSSNGVVGIDVTESSRVRLPETGSTISGPLASNFRVEGGAVMAFAAAPVTDASTLASLAVY
jgi:hypothetical protein